MMVFLLAYGVAQQAILYPDEPASWSVLSGVFYKPYFQVYGELFMEAPDTSKSHEYLSYIILHIYIAYYIILNNYSMSARWI